MIPLIQRDERTGLLHHQSNPVRVYVEDDTQRGRVNRSVRMVCDSLLKFQNGDFSRRVIELGCGCGDICGQVAEAMGAGNTVVGVDCNERCLKEAEKRYPHLLVKLSAIRAVLLEEWDMVILCELLEHLSDPLMVAKGALSKARLSVISHPLDEEKGSSLSGGDHQWIFSAADHKEFFRIGGHVIDETEIFQMGSYRIILSRGHHE